jgi:hypothetical protein
MSTYPNVFLAVDAVESTGQTPHSQYWRIYKVAEELLYKNPLAFEMWIHDLHDDENCYPLPYTFFRALVRASADDTDLIRLFIGTETKSVMFNDIEFPSHKKANRFGRMVATSGSRRPDLTRANQFLNTNGVPTGEVISTTLRDLLETRITEEWVNPVLADKMMDRMFWNLSTTGYGALYLTAVLFYARIVCNYGYSLPMAFTDEGPTLEDIISYTEWGSMKVPLEMCRVDGEFELDSVCFREFHMLTKDYGDAHTATFYKPDDDDDFAAHQEVVAVPGGLFCVSHGDKFHKIKLDYERMTRKQAKTTQEMIVPFVNNLQSARTAGFI